MTGAETLPRPREQRREALRIVVVGGTGLIGSRVVALLRAARQEPMAAAPTTGVDTISGAGLARALDGADVVVDVSNAPSYGDEVAAMDFFVTSTRNLLAAEAAAGVGHHVTLSAIGTRRLTESPYFRAKIAQERLIRDASIPYSFVHAGPFFELVPGIAAAATHGDTVRLAPIPIQPIAGAEAAAAVADISQGPPVGGIAEVAGPERLLLDQFVRHGLLARGEPRTVVPDPGARYFGAELHDRILLPGRNARRGRLRFHDWLLTRPTPTSLLAPGRAGRARPPGWHI